MGAAVRAEASCLGSHVFLITASSSFLASLNIDITNVERKT